MNGKTIHRRAFLRGAGSVLALPWLESVARGAERVSVPRRRMVAICNDLGVIPDFFFPTGVGRGYELSPYLRELKEFRDEFTVFSGLSHPECVGGHQTDKCFLTGARHPRKPGFKNTISVDQYAATQLGSATRFPYLALRVGPGGGSLSYSGDGVRMPAEERPSQVYRSLFVQGTPEEVRRQVVRLKDGQSLMDSFRDRIKSIQREAGYRDRERLDQFFTAFRELEQRLHENEAWEERPKPKVDVSMPRDERSPEALVARTRLMYDLARMAIETDSTRLITIFVTQQFNPKVDLPGVELPHHALTHQQGMKESREQLATVERAGLSEVGRLLGGLKETQEEGETLLDRTMLLYGSNMGHAGTHDNSNLPVLLAGGGFRHGQHVAFNRDDNVPLANLYLSMLQRLGVETDTFSSSSGALTGLEFV
ncbi:MAG: DUF1552 domain-containing protein [Verrucomicrobiota bacterium]